ncbi:hypothetical protein HDU92_005480 [Lobulomyces angularis]|nr:hypothetical protein HDU92_005480 [Lobulomyces angularis]
MGKKRTSKEIEATDELEPKSSESTSMSKNELREKCTILRTRFLQKCGSTLSDDIKEKLNSKKLKLQNFRGSKVSPSNFNDCNFFFVERVKVAGQSGKFDCFIPGCKNNFTSCLLLRKHLNLEYHDLKAALEVLYDNDYLQSSKEARLNFEKLKPLEETHISLVIKDFRFFGENSFFNFNVTFENNVNTEVVDTVMEIAEENLSNVDNLCNDTSINFEDSAKDLRYFLTDNFGSALTPELISRMNSNEISITNFQSSKEISSQKDFFLNVERTRSKGEVGTKVTCPIPGCHVRLSSAVFIRKHLNTEVHSLTNIIDLISKAEAAKNLPLNKEREEKLNQLKNIDENQLKETPFSLKNFRFYLDDAFYNFNVTFGFTEQALIEKEPDEEDISAVNKESEVATEGDDSEQKKASRKRTTTTPMKVTGSKESFIYPIPLQDHLSIFEDGDENCETVYNGLRPSFENFLQLSEKEATDYLPPKITTHILNSQSDVEVDVFSSAKLALQQDSVFILNTGASVWGLDWVPGVKDPENQYLACAGHHSTLQHTSLGKRQFGADMKGCIQFWKMNCLDENKNPELQLVILHDYGTVFDLKWMPYGGCEINQEEIMQNQDEMSRLGILAVAFGDGCFRIFNIPHISQLRQKLGITDLNEILYVEITTPLCEGRMADTLLWRLSWNGYQNLAVGCTNGCFSVWNIYDALMSKLKGKDFALNDIEPSVIFPAHDCSIRSVSCNDETKINRYLKDQKAADTAANFFTKPPSSSYHCISGGNDGNLYLHDIRDPYSPIRLQRIRGILYSCIFCPQFNGIVFSDDENQIRFLVRKNPKDEPKTEANSQTQKNEEQPDYDNLKAFKTSSLSCHKSVVWDMDCSKYIPFLCSGGADGFVNLSSMRRLNRRYENKVMLFHLYQLKWIKKKNAFEYVEHKQPLFTSEAISQIKGSKSVLCLQFPEKVSIQKVCWNPNKCSSFWVASVGKSGLLRVENTLNPSKNF